MAGLLLPTVGSVLAYLLTDIAGPAGSGLFGGAVTMLSNGNFVVADPLYDAGVVADVGAVYLYDGVTRQLIGTLVGSQASDQVGSHGVTALSNGNYVVSSADWDNGALSNAGAATWCSGTAGCIGTVSAANSLVGQAHDQVGHSVTALSNGNYVVHSSHWRNPMTSAREAGAVTWCSGTAGCIGTVSAANSLVGSLVGDNVGGYGLTVLSNSNYVVCSPDWGHSETSGAGAVTWCSGTAGCTGAISAANSLVGSWDHNDQVGSSGVTALNDGNYVVSSPYWANGAEWRAGAVTWCSGTAGCAGAVSAANSLVGSISGDYVGGNDGAGAGGVTALSNGDYVVRSPSWHNGAASDAGAVTWCGGPAGCTGAVSAANSLVGYGDHDQIGSHGVTALSNGDYVVNSPCWDNGATIDAGAATRCSGTAGCTGAISAANSLVGSTTYDAVGSNGVTVLDDGNYVVRSPYWHNGAAWSAGAVTWCSGTAGCTGAVSAANSLVGSTADDEVGFYDVIALSNGDYVVNSPDWDNGATSDAGAATRCSGTAGCVGVITAANSLVGSTAGDRVGFGGDGVTALSNGNYVVGSLFWDNGVTSDVGAATWCGGAVGCTGTVSAANSLVGNAAGDQVGFVVTALSNGNYVVWSPDWDNGATSNAGAVTWCSGTTGCSGTVSVGNSLVGSTADDQVGRYDVTAVRALSDGNYLVRSPYWDNGAASDAGAVTLGNGATGVAGPITAANSVRGTADHGGFDLDFDYDSVNGQLIVGRPHDNVVSIIGFLRYFLPIVHK